MRKDTRTWAARTAIVVLSVGRLSSAAHAQSAPEPVSIDRAPPPTVRQSMPQIAGLNAETAEHAPGEVFWKAIKDGDTSALFEAYLARSRRGQFEGRHADAAAARLSKLRGDSDGDSDVDASADSLDDGGFTRMTVSRTVTVRARPAFGAESMGKLAAGDTVSARIANVDGPWHKIVLESGKTGFVLEDPFGQDRRFE